MQKKIQINVVGKEDVENVIAYSDLVKCSICVSGRTCTFWTTEANYNALIFDSFFIRDRHSIDDTGIINQSNIFVEENGINNNLLITIPVSCRFRQQFYDIIKNSNLLIIKEFKISKYQFAATIQLNSCEDAYWLGRNHESLLKE